MEKLGVKVLLKKNTNGDSGRGPRARPAVRRWQHARMRHGGHLRRHQGQLGDRRRLRADGGARNRGRRSDALRRTIRDIYAVGECAQHRGHMYGLVAPLWEQAKVLADHITGKNTRAAYHGSKVATKLKVMGVEVASMGIVEPQYPEDEVVQFSEPKRGTYKKLIIRDGRLVGGILLGDISKAAYLMQAFDRNTPLPEERLHLLFDIGRSAQAGDVRGDEREHADLQLQRREQGRSGGLRECRQAQREGRDGCHARGHGLRLVQEHGGGNRGVGVRRRNRRRSVGPLLRSGRAADQAGTDSRDSGAQLEIGFRGFRLSGGRERRRRQQTGPGLAAEDAVEGRIRGRKGRALHQRARPRQHSEGRHVLRGSADARRHHQPRAVAPHRRSSPKDITCRW